MTTYKLNELEELLDNDIKILKIFEKLGISLDDEDIEDIPNVISKKESLELLTKILNQENPNKNEVFLTGSYKLIPPESLKVELFKELKNDKYLIGYDIKNIDYSDPFLIKDKLNNLEFLFIDEEIIEYDNRIILRNYDNFSIIRNPLIKIKNNKPYLYGHSGIKYNFKDKLIPTSDLMFYKEFVEEEVISQILKNTKF